MNKPIFLIVTTIPKSLGFFKGQVQILKNEFNVEVLSSSGNRLENFCKEENVKGHVVEMERDISILKDIVSFFNMIKCLFKIKPYCVHGNTPKGGLISMCSAWLLRVPKRIYYVHGLRYEGTNGTKRKLLIGMERLSCFFATDIFAVSKGILLTLSKDKITSKKINVIHYGSINGLDTKRFNLDTIKEFNCAREQYDIPHNNFVYGFVGRIVKDKGIDELVEVFIKLHKKYKNIHLLLIGGFDENLNPISDYTRHEITYNPNITHAGTQSDVRPFLKAMDVFVFPSYREGFGISLIEAQAMGVPCISSDISGCNEIIQTGMNGLLIKPKDQENLYVAMKMVLLDKDLYEKMKNYTRKSVIQRYEQKQLWKETLRSYKAILN